MENKNTRLPVITNTQLFVLTNIKHIHVFPISALDNIILEKISTNVKLEKNIRVSQLNNLVEMCHECLCINQRDRGDIQCPSTYRQGYI